MYSVKMRASLSENNKGTTKHISGAERIVAKDDVKELIAAFYERAITHQRGEPDFINIKIQKIDESTLRCCPLLDVFSRNTKTKTEGLEVALEELIRAGVSYKAASMGIEYLLQRTDSMRGAMVVSSVTGKRLDSMEDRGIRCSNMDCKNKNDYRAELNRRGLTTEHAREALILASKVASAKGTVAELCWSDDPDYVTGYVASPKNGYCRISVMKEYGDPVGGRVFFVNDDVCIEDYISYIQNQVVLVDTDYENK